MIYLDNAATTPLSPGVRKVMKKALKKDFANTNSVYAIGRQAAYNLEICRKTIADKMGVSPKTIYFTSGGSEGNTWMIKNYVAGATGKTNEFRILYCNTSHHSVLNSVENSCVKIDTCELMETGRCDLDKLSEKIKIFSPNLVIITWVNNEIGCMELLPRIVDIIKEFAPFSYIHVDGVQASTLVFNKLYNEVIKRINSLTVSAHKLYGPKGVGLVYINNVPKIMPLIYGGDQERGLRGGTINLPSIMGFAEAVKEFDAEKVFEYNITSFRFLLTQLKENNIKFSYNGVPDKFTGIVNLNVGMPTPEIVTYLDGKNIYVSTGAACDNPEEGSHVLKAMGIDSHVGLRVSFGRFTTKRDIKIFVKELANIIKILKNIGGN